MSQDKLVKWLRLTIVLSCFLCLVAVAALPAHAEPEELTIAAASDLNFAFKELIKDFQTQTGERVKLIGGSSGHFYTHIHKLPMVTRSTCTSPQILPTRKN